MDPEVKNLLVDNEDNQNQELNNEKMNYEQDEQYDAPQKDSVIETPGQILKRARLEKGLDVKFIASELKLMTRFIEGIEEDNYDKLPGPAFIWGYIRGYAKILDIPLERIESVYRSYVNIEEEKIELVREVHGRNFQNKSFLQWAKIGLGIIIVLIILMWWTAKTSRDSNPQEGVTEVNEITIDKADGTTITKRIDADFQDSETLQAMRNSAEAFTTSDVNETNTNSVENKQALNQESLVQDLSDVGTVAVAVKSSVPTLSESISDSSSVGTLSSESETAQDLVEELISEGAGSEADTEANSEASSNDAQSVIASLKIDSSRVIIERIEDNKVLIASTSGTDSLKLFFTDECWVEIRDANEELLFGNLTRVNDELNIMGLAPFDVLMGNARVVSAEFNEKEYDFASRIKRDNSARIIIQ